MNSFTQFSRRPILSILTKGMLCALGAGGLLAISMEAAATPPDFATGRILVQPLSGLSEGRFSKIVGNFGGKSLKHLKQINVHVVKVPDGKEDEFVELFSKHPHIAFAEKDGLIEATATPNDPYFASEWHLQKIQAPTAWNTTLGSSAVTVAVLDSGVDSTHPDLSGKLVDGWNVVSNNGDTSPVAGHGTWVAGVVGAANNNGLGVASTGWNTLVQPVRITNDPNTYAYWSDVANGIIWAADHGAKIANISYDLASSCGATSMRAAAQYMRNKGGLVVGSAGNDSLNVTCADEPAWIVVAATDGNDARPSWSNYGSFIDIAAPGTSIYTTASGGGYSTVQGTSFSSPITAGVLALMVAANPNLTPDQYESLLKTSADNISGGALPNPYFGWGRVNAANAVASAKQYVAVDTTPPTTVVVSPANGSTVAGTQVVSVSAQDSVGVAKVELYANNQLVGTSTTGPSYQFAWDTTKMADGNVPVYTFAYDSAGNRGASSINTVKVSNTPPVADTTPPTVSITNPLSGAKLSGNTSITVKAADNVALKQVQLFIDGREVTTTNTGSLSYTWKKPLLTVGTHTITSIATDTSNWTKQVAISVTVTK